MRTGSDDVRAAALEVVGNLAFCAANRAGLLATDGLLPLVVRLVASDEASTKAIVRTAAIRALAILGELTLRALFPCMLGAQTRISSRNMKFWWHRNCQLCVDLSVASFDHAFRS